MFSSKYDYFLFDMDGTLINSAPGVTKAVQYALHEVGVEVPDLNDLLKFIGPPIKVSFATFYPLTEEQQKKCIDLFHVYYDDNKGFNDCFLYDGIVDVVKKLNAAGKKTVLCTSKPLVTAEAILDELGIKDLFTFLEGGSYDEKKSSKKDLIEDVIKELQIEDISKMLMIGDRHFDIDGANQTGIDSMGVLYGFGNEKEFLDAGATYIVKEVSDILPAVQM